GPKGPRIPATFSDGMSNTVLFAEGYGAPKGNTYSWWSGTQNITGYPGNASKWPTGPTYWAGYPTAYTPMSPPFYVGVAPQNIASTDRPDAYTTAGLYVAMGDGSVRFVHSSVSSTTWLAANHPSDGTVLPGDW